jgi:hypothetical protein
MAKMSKLGSMKKSTKENTKPEKNSGNDRNPEQTALLKALMGTVMHFFSGWQTIFRGMIDRRNPVLSTYPLASLLCTGVLLFLFRLGSRRQIHYQLHENEPSQAKLGSWFEVPCVPQGDTLNYAFQRLQPAEMQEVVYRLMEVLIHMKVLYRWRLFDNFLTAVVGTEMLTFGEPCFSHPFRHSNPSGLLPCIADPLRTPLIVGDSHLFFHCPNHIFVFLVFFTAEIKLIYL